MIDLHSHILYGIDDGSASLDESLAMCRMAAADGVTHIVATPHSPASSASRNYSADLIRQRVEELQTSLNEQGVSLTVLAGTEIRYHADMLTQLKQGALLSYPNTSTILLEVPNNALPSAIEHAVFVAQAAGYRVILTHPERCAVVQRDPNVLLSLIERGTLMQVTAAALTGEQGDLLLHTAEALLTHGMVHLLASDTHGLPPRRAPLLSLGRARAAALIGDAQAEALVTTIPAAILNKAPVTLPPPRPIDRSRWKVWRS